VIDDQELRSGLGELAESVQNVDLYERSLSRSRRIGRRRALSVSAAAAAVLALAGFGLLSLGTPPPVEPAHRLADRGGSVYYQAEDGNELMRLRPDGSVSSVLSVPHEAVAVSADGLRVAYVAAGQLRLADGTVLVRSGVTIDQQLPAWSPDGTKLLVGTPAPAILTLATGNLSPTPPGRFFRWSGDGRLFVYATPACRLIVGTSTVPIISDPDNAVNPDGIWVCSPISVDKTGRRVTASIGDPGRPSGNALIDTSTGTVLPSPVTGSVLGMTYGPAGNLLVRTKTATGDRLSVVAPDGTILRQDPEPAALAALEVIAYTR
jgi:TolB protein